MTELCDRVLKAGGPALLFEQPKGDFRAPNGGTIPVLGNLFGTPQRVARAMGVEGDDWREALREIGRLLAFLKEPDPPKSLKDAWQNDAAGVHEGARHGAQGAQLGAVPGRRVGGRRRRSRAVAGADVLAG